MALSCGRSSNNNVSNIHSGYRTVKSLLLLSRLNLLRLDCLSPSLWSTQLFSIMCVQRSHCPGGPAKHHGPPVLTNNRQTDGRTDRRTDRHRRRHIGQAHYPTLLGSRRASQSVGRSAGVLVVRHSTGCQREPLVAIGEQLALGASTRGRGPAIKFKTNRLAQGASAAAPSLGWQCCRHQTGAGASQCGSTARASRQNFPTLSAGNARGSLI